MKIEIINNGDSIREAFNKKFLLTWEEFQTERKDWLQETAKSNFTINYDTLFSWDKMRSCPAVSFAKALELLKSCPGEVCFLSESESHPYNESITINDTKYKGIVAKADPVELAEQIESEWYACWKASSEGMYFAATLPVDLYVFDRSMEHLIVFTHENDHWELEDEEPMKAAASRFCMAYGFPIDNTAVYRKLQALFSKELAQNSSLEIGISCSSATQFREFIISKWTTENNENYIYWYDFDSDVKYHSFEELANAKVLNGQSLNEIGTSGTAWIEITAIDGNEPF